MQKIHYLKLCSKCLKLRFINFKSYRWYQSYIILISYMPFNLYESPNSFLEQKNVTSIIFFLIALDISEWGQKFVNSRFLWSSHQKGSTRLNACNFIKKKHRQMCFPVNIAKFLRIPILEHLRTANYGFVLQSFLSRITLEAHLGPYQIYITERFYENT